MSRNAANLYGRDVRCVRDADKLFTEVTGLDLVRQDALHRLMTDDVLGDDGTGSEVIVGWGFDVRRLLGLPPSRLPSYQPILASVLERDPRIDSATVLLEATTTRGVADALLRATCVTALGPFTLIRKVSDLTAADLVGQP